jgi:hypothetical protein
VPRSVNAVDGWPAIIRVFFGKVFVTESVITVMVSVEEIVGRITACERFDRAQYLPCHTFADMRINHQNTVFA